MNLFNKLLRKNIKVNSKIIDKINLIEFITIKIYKKFLKTEKDND